MTTFTSVGTFHIETCPECGIRFGIPDAFERHRRKDHNTFFCPNGHSQYYAGQSEAEQLRAENQRLKSSNAYLTEGRDHYQRSARAYRGQVTKIKNRVGKGVCPCCNRTFADLGAHMKSKHPSWTEDEQ